jgi:DNA-binding Lrp family transcriptional regulator
MRMRKLTLDALDYKILWHLSRNAREPLNKVARAANVSLPTVSERLQRLIELGVIKGFRTELNYDALGLGFLAITFVNTKYGHDYANRVSAKIAKISGVQDIHFVLGDLDFIVTSRARDREDLKRIVNGFINIPEIEKTSTHIVLDTIKEGENWSLDLRLPKNARKGQPNTFTSKENGAKS